MNIRNDLKNKTQKKFIFISLIIYKNDSKNNLLWIVINMALRMILKII